MSASSDKPVRWVLWGGLGCSGLIVTVEGAYAVALILGLAATGGPGAPIGEPYFTIMEGLILLMMPAVVGLAVAVHATCASRRRPFALAAIVFAAMLATVTSCVHAVILALGRESALADMPYLLSFEWPSVVYVLDVLAWDVFFGFFAVCLGASFERGGLGGWLRWVLIASGVLAFAGLWGAVIGDMRFRNIGILGYVAGFTVAAAGLAVHFRRCLRRVT